MTSPLIVVEPEIVIARRLPRNDYVEQLMRESAVLVAAKQEPRKVGWHASGWIREVSLDREVEQFAVSGAWGKTVGLFGPVRLRIDMLVDESDSGSWFPLGTSRKVCLYVESDAKG